MISLLLKGWRPGISSLWWTQWLCTYISTVSYIPVLMGFKLYENSSHQKEKSDTWWQYRMRSNYKYQTICCDGGCTLYPSPQKGKKELTNSLQRKEMLPQIEGFQSWREEQAARPHWGGDVKGGVWALGGAFPRSRISLASWTWAEEDPASRIG